MPKFSEASEKNLSECDERLQRIFRRVIEYRDCSIVEGYRGSIEQNHQYKIGQSHLQYPDSEHNKTPSHAADAWPYPRPAWNDTKAWREWATFVVGVAAGLDIQLKSGGLSWGWDYPHFELVD